MKKILRIIGIVLIILILGIVGFLIYLSKGLPDVGAAPNLTINVTPAMVKRGAYLANHVSVCIDCHSHRDWTRFAGPIIPETEGEGGERFDRNMGLPGVIYSKNITPYNLKNWTDGEIYRAITTGVTKEGKALFPIMPYHYYGQMAPQDVKSIIAYLRTLKPIKNTTPEHQLDFPMNFIVNTIPEKAKPMKLPPKSDTLAYGHYLTTIAGCRECHTNIVKGKPVGPAFSGGRMFKMPDGSIIRSENITPDKQTGIGTLTQSAFVNIFRSYVENGYVPPKVKKGKIQTVMPWNMYGGMDTTDLAAIYTYLRSIKPVKHKVNIFTPAKN